MAFNRGVFIVWMTGIFQSLFYMSETINWPRGEFTIEEAVSLNPAFPQAVIRKKLSAAMAAKAIIQTQKGNGKIKGKFQVVKSASAAGN